MSDLDDALTAGSPFRTRLKNAIMLTLHEHGEMTAEEIAKRLDIKVTSCRRVLIELRADGVIKLRTQEPNFKLYYYKLDRRAIISHLATLRRLLA